MCDFGLLFFLCCLIFFFLLFRVRVCARGRCVGNFCYFFLLPNFLLLANITIFFSVSVICFQLANFGSNQKGKLPNRNQSRLLNRDRFLHLSPPPAAKKKPEQPPETVSARVSLSPNTHSIDGGQHTYRLTRTLTTPQNQPTKKRTNERKNESPEPPSRNPANCTGRRANFSRTRSESGSTRARPHFRPGFAHKTPVFHSNSADRTQSRTRL